MVSPRQTTTNTTTRTRRNILFSGQRLPKNLHPIRIRGNEFVISEFTRRPCKQITRRKSFCRLCRHREPRVVDGIYIYSSVAKISSEKYNGLLRLDSFSSNHRARYYYYSERSNANATGITNPKVREPNLSPLARGLGRQTWWDPSVRRSYVNCARIT